ncbi:MAG: tetratricopeptide repeat protein [Gammaproteobacteria bacterium]
MRFRKESRADAADLNHAAYARGCELYDSGEYSQALAAFREATSYWPEDPDAWMAIANCYDSLRRPKQAEKVLRKALDLGKEKIRDALLYNLGNSLYDQGRFEEAIAVYESLPPGTEIWESAQLNAARARKRT